MQYTPHIRLPLFESADKPTWLYDWNETMMKLDDTLFNMSSADMPPEIASMLARIEALERTVSQHTTSIETLEADVTSILADIANLQSAIDRINALIPSNASTSNQLATMADISGGGQGGGSGSSVSVDYINSALDYVFDEVGYYASLRIPLDGKPIGMTINMAHTFIFDADTLSQQTPPLIYEENNTHGGEITYSLAKEGDVWYLEVYGEATGPAHDGFDVYVLLIKASETPAPPSGGDVTTITDPQVTSGASTLNAETLSITDVTPLS